MTRKVSTRTTWEPVAGYSRAVAAGDFIFVSGCTSVADRVVDQGIHGFLENTLFIAENNIGRADFLQLLQAIISVDDAAIQVVHV